MLFLKNFNIQMLLVPTFTQNFDYRTLLQDFYLYPYFSFIYEFNFCRRHFFIFYRATHKTYLSKIWLIDVVLAPLQHLSKIISSVLPQVALRTYSRNLYSDVLLSSRNVAQNKKKGLLFR